MTSQPEPMSNEPQDLAAGTSLREPASPAASSASSTAQPSAKSSAKPVSPQAAAPLEPQIHVTSPVNNALFAILDARGVSVGAKGQSDF
jgi:hypothetical protein